MDNLLNTNVILGCLLIMSEILPFHDSEHNGLIHTIINVMKLLNGKVPISEESSDFIRRPDEFTRLLSDFEPIRYSNFCNV
jgi:hypothetical protein